ncbi:MAG: uracil-DNA glycosylase [Ruminiclostridium sp.]
MTVEGVNCHRCKYYYITWDARMPYGCKAFGIKTRQIPSVVVYQTSGKSCQGYEEKEQRTKPSKR